MRNGMFVVYTLVYRLSLYFQYALVYFPLGLKIHVVKTCFSEVL